MNPFQCKGRILFLQHANPAAYPPLEYSSRILSDKGWAVHFIGMQSPGSENLTFPPHANISLRVFPFSRPGWRQKVAYLRFILIGIYTAFKWRPDWVYASDLLAAPCALVLAKLFGIRVIYHEHDSPAPSDASTIFIRWLLKARTALARTADFNVLPQRERLACFVKETGTNRPVFCVWNCPPRVEAETEIQRERKSGEPLGVYFHGSINLERLPLTLIEGAALSGVPVRLRIVGYETIGSQGTVARLIAAADKAGPLVTLELPGQVSRHLLGVQMKGMHVGWINCLNPKDDINLRYFVGASVKAFDYLAAGLPLITSSGEDWKEFYESPGYSRSCNASDARSVADCIQWFYDHPEKLVEMGRSGQRRILEEWNYENQFEPVMRRLMTSS
jgi:glycosyltransferase involved in cell wall biosynthesis